MSTLHQRDGKTSRQVYVERARAWKEAKKVSDETGVELSIVLGDLGATVQRTGAQQTGGPEAQKPGGPE